MTFVVTVLKEDSAQDIDVQVSERYIKLVSDNYELEERFQVFVDPESLKCKFSKKNKTLTLTCNVTRIPGEDERWITNSL